MESTSTIIKHAARAVIAGALAASAWACGSSAPSRELVDARRAYERAQASAASRYTPDELLSARQALDAAERAHENDPGSHEEAHLAYLAARRAQIAAARGEMAQSKQAEAKAEAEYRARLQRSAQAKEEQLAKQQSELEEARQAQIDAEAARHSAEQRMQAALQSLSKVATVREEERGTVITLGGSVLFATGKYELLPIAQQSLSRVAAALKDEQPEGKIIIEGHTDSRGGARMNEELSEKRAQAVADYLASQGIDPSRIQIVGRGESDPIASNDTPEGRANNRRVEIVLSREGAAGQGTTFGATPQRPTPGAAAKTLPDEPKEPMQEEQDPQQQGAPPPQPDVPPQPDAPPQPDPLQP